MGACYSNTSVPTCSRDEGSMQQALNLLHSSPLFPPLLNLKKVVSGEVLLPSDKKYHTIRERVYNKDVAGYPLIIVVVSSSRDVQECVKFIKKYGEDIKLCVASGCHSHKCMLNGSFVIDLSLLNSIKVNLVSQTVAVGGGAKVQDVDYVCTKYNLVLPLGTHPYTGCGGSILAGGYGYLSRQFGMTADSLIECEVVLPNGDLILVNDKNEYADLMKGLRGGGGNFGVVTKFTLQLRPLPPHVYGGFVSYLTPSLPSARQICIQFDEAVQSFTNETSGFLVLTAGSNVTQTGFSYVGHARTMKELPASLLSARSLGGVKVENSFKPMNFRSGLQQMLKHRQTGGYFYQDLVQVGAHDCPLPPSCFEKLIEYIRIPTTASITKASVFFFAMGGQIVKEDDGTNTSISLIDRRARYFTIIEVFFNPAYGDAGRRDAKKWCQQTVSLLNNFSITSLKYTTEGSDSRNTIVSTSAASGISSSQSIGSITASDSKEAEDEQAIECPSIMLQSKISLLRSKFRGRTKEEIVQRLAQLKLKYDPTNMFSQNANIEPATTLRLL